MGSDWMAVSYCKQTWCPSDTAEVEIVHKLGSTTEIHAIIFTCVICGDIYVENYGKFILDDKDLP